MATEASIVRARVLPALKIVGRILWITYRRHIANQGSLRAGGLTYLTLMSLVPGLTVVLVIANGFGIRDQLRSYLDQLLEGAPGKLVELKDQVMTLVEGVSIEAVGALGLFVFIYVVISMLTRVEQALNVTWMAERGRSLARRYADYIALLFLIPLLVLLATGLKTAIAMDKLVEGSPWLRSFVESGLSFLPFVFLWIAAVLLYKVMPNVQVRWGPAAIAGLVAGASWYVAQGLFLALQIGISRANAIYGSLALLPVLLFYLYLSWTIVLLGAELCHAIQNRQHLQLPREALAWMPALRRRLGLLLMREAVARFRSGKALSLASFCGTTGWSQRRVDEVVRILVQSGILHRVQLGQAVVPARPPGETPIASILSAIDGADDPLHQLAAEDETALRDVREHIERTPGRV